MQLITSGFKLLASIIALRQSPSNTTWDNWSSKFKINAFPSAKASATIGVTKEVRLLQNANRISPLGSQIKPPKPVLCLRSHSATSQLNLTWFSFDFCQDLVAVLGLGAYLCITPSSLKKADCNESSWLFAVSTTYFGALNRFFNTKEFF